MAVAGVLAEAEIGYHYQICALLYPCDGFGNHTWGLLARGFDSFFEQGRPSIAPLASLSYFNRAASAARLSRLCWNCPGMDPMALG